MKAPDLDAVLAIEKVSYGNPWSREGFLNELARPEVCQSRVACSVSVVGYALAWIAADELEIGKLTVQPGFRKRGIGRRLLQDVLDLGARASCRHAHLEVRESNVAAIHLYRGMGFETSGRRPGYYGGAAENGIRMAREIG